METEFNETARVEAFSDAVFAIAMTLLVLELKIPHQGKDQPGVLLQQLMDQRSMYVAFLTSFVTIGIMWIKHHRLFTLIQRRTHTLILLNLLLMLGVTVVPFPTAVLAQNLSDPLDVKIAALFYNGWFAFIAIMFNALWRYASSGGRLLAQSVDQRAVRAQTRQFALLPLFYLVAFAVAWINGPLSIAISLSLALVLARQDEDELVSAVAGQGRAVVGDRPSQEVSHLAQDLAAREMPVPVVDRFQVVEVEEHDAEVAAVA